MLAGLCFVLPAFGIMLALAMTYAHLGATPIMRGGLYGLGPVVLGIFVVTVYCLGRSTVTTVAQILIAITAAALAYSPLGITTILALAAGVGLWLFQARRVGAWSLMVLTVYLAVTILQVFERVRTLVWSKAAMRGVGPAVIGVMAVFLVCMAPHALPDLLAVAMLLGTLIALLTWRVGAFKLANAGVVLGVLRSRLMSLPGVRATL